MNVWNHLKRWKNDDRPVPDSWRAILQQKFTPYANFSDEDRDAFEAHLKHFIWSKNWEGAGGLEVDEEMKVLVAASAARIARRLPLSVYDKLESIVIYPGTFEHREGLGALGLAHPWGTVVLSWDAVKHGIANPHDGNDTTVHEFAHVLDFEDGLADGTPLLENGEDYRAWVRVMGKHFARLKNQGRIKIVLDDYGALNEAEFFAVATESFFEKPSVLKRVAPDLFEVLRDFYRVDPGQPDHD